MSDSVPVPSSTSAASASFVGSDATTQGNWRSAYGADGYNIAQDTSATNPVLPAYATLTITGASDAAWSTNPNDNRDLQDAAGTGRGLGAWYTDGTMDFHLNLSDGQAHRVAFYALDPDGFAGGRAERFDAIDTATGAVLDSRTLTAFQGGTYLAWDLSGDVTVRVTNLNPNSNALASGLFLGGTTPPMDPIQTKVTLTAPSPASGYVLNDSAAWTVTLDAAAPATGSAVSLASSVAGDVFRATAGGAPVTSITIAPGATDGSFYLHPASPGPRQVTIASNGLTVAGSPAAYSAAAPTLAAAPGLLFKGSTTAVTFTGDGTSWKSAAPTFTPSGLSGVTVGDVTVTSDTTATAPVTAGSAVGTVTVTDSTSGASVTATVVPGMRLISVVDFGAESAGNLGAVGYTVYSYANGALAEFQPRTTAGVAVQGSLCVAEFNAVVGGIYYIDWDSGGATPTHLYDYLDRWGYNLISDGLDAISASSGIDIRQSLALVLDAFLSALNRS